MNEPILSVKNLSKTFKLHGREDVKAVSNVTFDLFPGETLGVIGESGSGKTTLVNLITGLLPKGLMIYEKAERNENPYYRDRRDRNVSDRSIRALDPLHALFHHSGHRDLPVHHEGHSALWTHEESGGQCQRAAIARALAIEPKLLVCDEATSALDVTIQAEIIELLVKLRKELDMAILFICHDIALVQQFCDRVVVMYHGELVEEGKPDEVIAEPKNDYTQDLINSIL